MAPTDAERLLSSFASTRFRELRPSQARALNALLAPGVRPSDLVLDLPTGSGKTLVGLLAAASAMSVGGSAVYLTGSRALANQVAREAAQLNLPADVMSAPLVDVNAARRMRVNQGRTLGVMNYWAYFAEPSVVDPPSVLIFDDAHLAESAVEDKYALTIERRDDESLYLSLLTEVSLRAPGYGPIDDLIGRHEQDWPATYCLAFADVVAIEPFVRSILDERLPAHPERRYRYSWNRVREGAQRMLWLVSGTAFQIRPLRYPLASDLAFAGSGSRLYMSATIGDLTDLRRRLGTPPLNRLALDNPEDTAVPGHRFLVLPADDGQADPWPVRQALWSTTPRTVWFCRSHGEATALMDALASRNQVAMLMDREGAALNWFSAATDAHLVLAGRYDGMDFSGDIARLAFFTSPPWGVNPFDEFLTPTSPRPVSYGSVSPTESHRPLAV